MEEADDKAKDDAAPSFKTIRSGYRKIIVLTVPTTALVGDLQD